MLRTNSRLARFNVMQYILMHYTPEEHDAPKASASNFKAVAKYILDIFFSEIKAMGENTGSVQKDFSTWCCALPSIIDCKYHYNRSAIADVSGILEQTKDEAKHYTEQQAEALLDKLILSTLAKASVAPDRPAKVIGFKD